MWGFFFNDRPVTNFAIAAQSDDQAWTTWVSAMVRHGINLAPSPYEAAFFSSAHGKAEIVATFAAADAAFAEVARGR
jgi:glutamate-1-semialdehyde 2,1-aminomutase